MGLIAILACVLYSNGLAAVWNVLKMWASAIAEFVKFLFSLAMQFPGELGITDLIWTKLIFIMISVGMFVITGYVFTKKEKKRLLGVVSAVVGLVSTLLAFA